MICCVTVHFPRIATCWRQSNVRLVSQVTGSVVQSWSEPAGRTPGSFRRPSRVFRIQGRKRAVQAAVETVQEAVQRCALRDCPATVASKSDPLKLMTIPTLAPQKAATAFRVHGPGTESSAQASGAASSCSVSSAFAASSSLISPLRGPQTPLGCALPLQAACLSGREG